MTDRAILLDLLTGTRCACTASKQRRMSFCRGCYGRLPEGMRKALYATDGTYPDAYRRALTVLSPPEPGAVITGDGSGSALPPFHPTKARTCTPRRVTSPPDRGPVPKPTQPFQTTHK